MTPSLSKSLLVILAISSTVFILFLMWMAISGIWKYAYCQRESIYYAFLPYGDSIHRKL
jgi:hypothetical protein